MLKTGAEGRMVKTGAEGWMLKTGAEGRMVNGTKKTPLQQRYLYK
jgi:hypothetical protein